MWSTSFERSHSYLFEARSPRLWYNFWYVICWLKVPLFHIVQIQMGVAFNCFFLGMLFGSLFFGWISDAMGRRFAFGLCLLCLSLQGHAMRCFKKLRIRKTEHSFTFSPKIPVCHFNPLQIRVTYLCALAFGFMQATYKHKCLWRKGTFILNEIFTEQRDTTILHGTRFCGKVCWS